MFSAISIYFQENIEIMIFQKFKYLTFTFPDDKLNYFLWEEAKIILLKKVDISFLFPSNVSFSSIKGQ